MALGKLRLRLTEANGQVEIKKSKRKKRDEVVNLFLFCASFMATFKDVLGHQPSLLPFLFVKFRF